LGRRHRQRRVLALPRKPPPIRRRQPERHGQLPRPLRLQRLQPRARGVHPPVVSRGDAETRRKTGSRRDRRGRRGVALAAKPPSIIRPAWPVPRQLAPDDESRAKTRRRKGAKAPSYLPRKRE